MKNLEYYRKLEKTSNDCTVGDLFEAQLHINEGKLIIPELDEEIIINRFLSMYFSGWIPL